MSLKELLDEGRLEETATSREEIADLLNTASRGLSDAAVEQVSIDGRFNFAYDAALVLATIPLRCAGYRTRGEGHHRTVFDALPDAMGESHRRFSRYLQKCRRIRNLSTYSKSGIVSQNEVKHLIADTKAFDIAVRRWLQENYPQYC